MPSLAAVSASLSADFLDEIRWQADLVPRGLRVQDFAKPSSVRFRLGEFDRPDFAALASLHNRDANHLPLF
jgi:hypothetical protein